MRTRRLGLAAIFLAATAALPLAQAQKPPVPPPPAAAAAKNVSVTINYTGKGAVDATHTVLVFLFSDPNIGPGAKPIGPPQIIQKNGGTVTFKDVTASPVYIAAVYNEKGTYDGTAPPPAGTPIGIYAKAPKQPALPVTPGSKTTVKMSFSDATKFGS